MPRYKEANYAQGQFIAIQFEHQILPGSFERVLSAIVISNITDQSKGRVVWLRGSGGTRGWGDRIMRAMTTASDGIRGRSPRVWRGRGF